MQRTHTSLSVTLELLDTFNEHGGRRGLPHLSIEHCLVQGGVRPFPPEILPDELSSRFVRCIDLFDCLVLSCTPERSVCGSYDLWMHREIHGRHLCDCAENIANLDRQ